MEKQIKKNLSEIEKEYNVEILYSCESGSRGWEFSSPESDYDVRFVYIQPIEDYLTICSKKE
ncbi:DNA polymerase beta superfamily protein [Bacteroides sp. 224]|uniref:DNA polymerase beta superfamily protein n=1 Tax=Bacteroides sp. 224 TaxID=2302936 RepID=UPI0013D51A6F|nr:nucleotidyltransferase domain-containing protein [Bacteroides sp. 224]NDV65896.1 hypothetical protein [Bacteroides sp. 224]